MILRHRDWVINANNNKEVGYVKCKMWRALIRYDSKKMQTGSYQLCDMVKQTSAYVA